MTLEPLSEMAILSFCAVIQRQVPLALEAFDQNSKGHHQLLLVLHP
jgi:hypothetical protein